MRSSTWLLALAVAALVGCAPTRQKAITIKGSDTMVILGQRWAESYMASHPGAVIQVTGGGSGTGIAALINGTTDICQSSRAMKDEEKQQAAAKLGTPPVEVVVARDGLSIYVADSNPVRELTLAQIKAIYTGQVTNWKDVGGSDAAITVYGRENNSGTYVYFKEHVLEGADFAAIVQTLPGTAAVVNAVSQDAKGIGYGGAAYATGVRDLAVRKDATSEAVLPTLENMNSGSYPIARSLYYYLATPGNEAVMDFIAFALSDSGQKLVTEVGYFPAQ
ncbi:MAG: phosphate ABC transporter substrate-binding protein [Candidatus Eisenbacteria bacterium]|uniref:Phosphate-binding protein n=1 Tax=Eiseniibacteriota bacterium TaxID=2212470 RepID=A0A849SGB8_UNCEI|nr:phosphate ABC transporter substrate-binding protein [Candidatus Eisenbacteria bacterium]